ncbi:MAG TPA: hypothetical protein VEH04_12475 [Verrucomicrobiae bacterium]|nr:hypothetical protein [Verrucomicrobiae bacterium]
MKTVVRIKTNPAFKRTQPLPWWHDGQIVSQNFGGSKAAPVVSIFTPGTARNPARGVRALPFSCLYFYAMALSSMLFPV